MGGVKDKKAMAQTSDTLYLKIDRNIQVPSAQVYLRDIAKMECANEAVLRQLKQKKIYTFQEKDADRKKKRPIVVFSVLKVIQKIHEDYPQLEVQNMGETDFVLELSTDLKNGWLDMLKTVVLCVVIFFGAAFTIMSFNNDVGVGDVFTKLYTQVMGAKPKGVTEIEICYAIGMPIGIFVFYNHIGKKKITPDPTPIQVEMRKYEQDVDDAFIENASREGNDIDVD